jgi:hypothetical protein
MEKKSDSKSRYDDKYGDDEDDKSGDKSSEGKFAESKGETEYLDDGKNENEFDIPQIDVMSVTLLPSSKCAIEDPLELTITFALDRDVVAGFWEFKVVHSCFLCSHFFFSLC